MKQEIDHDSNKYMDAETKFSKKWHQYMIDKKLVGNPK